MITKDNLCDLLLDMGYGEVDTGVYEKKYPDFDCSITVDYNKELIIYPEEKGFQVNDRTTSNFDENENFVVLELSLIHIFARSRNMSQATALGARMCQGTFFFI